MNQSINWKTAARLAGAAGLLMAGAWSLAGRAAEPAAPAAAPAVAPAVKLPDAAGRLIVFSSDFDLTALKPSAVEVALGGTAEAPALRITAKAQGNWPGVGLTAPGGAWDLSAYEYVAMDIRNVDKHDIDVFVRIDNAGANGRDHCTTDRIGTQPDQRVTLTIPIRRQAQSAIKLFGMNGFPQGMYASGGIDPSKVIALTIFTENKPLVSHSFEVSNIRVFGRYEKPKWAEMTEKEFFPCIDKFGQFIHKDWPGKVHDDAELQANRTAEAAQLAADAGPGEWDKWGGWAAGPKLEATGNFRTAKHQGKWWLVDPDGRLFFSTGITGVGTGWAATPVDDRESWFQDLPSQSDNPLHAYLKKGGQSWGGGYYQGKSPVIFNLSSANLQRKYGADWAKTYPDVVHQRLRAWGLNTIGNWSDGRIAGLHRTPYTCTFFYDSPRLKNNKVQFPDMFDPAFAPALNKGFAQFQKGSWDDPWCIGYFLDNEMPWGGDDALAGYALASPATQAAKKRLAAWLQERHPAITDLNTAWGTKWASWDAFAADTAAKPATAAAKADLVEFTGLMAETYFRTVRDTIKKAAPNRLYLGCRCVGGSSNVIAAAVKNCDVISYNRYCASVRDIRLPDNQDAPVLIGEFHFGGLDRGPFWSGLFYAENQEDRAKKLTAYLQSAIDNPQIVGAHWFQYGDEAATGRIDGENAQCGFVDVCDTPYVETTRAARAVAETMYRRR